MSRLSIPKWLRTLFERACLLVWVLLMTANTIVLGWAIELFVLGILLSFYQIALINQYTAPLLLCGVFAVFNFALISRLWDCGVQNLSFELHERAFNAMVELPPSWSNSLLVLLDESTKYSNELEMLVQLIEEAPGPVERQDRRAEAKIWLKENRDKLSAEDKEFVKEKLGYLH
jgi:ABC-type multidrug transport system fused ATPase/permease subunit